MESSKESNKKNFIIKLIVIIAIISIISFSLIIINQKLKGTIETSSEPENVEISMEENTSDDALEEEQEEKLETETDNKEEIEIEENKSIIYLTFDDGPSNSITPNILDILKEEQVEATFFVINYSQDKENLVQREVEEGHAIGIHGYSHNYKKIYKSEEVYMKNVNDLQTKIEETTGVKTTITRFPGGSSNTVSRFNKNIMTKLTKRIEEEGYKYYDWNVDSDDAGSAKNKDQVYENVTQSLKKERANVVLMHDFESNNKTLDALKDIIEYGKQNDYTFKKITAESDLVMHHKVQN